MFKDRAFRITALAVLILAVSFFAWYFWLRPRPSDHGVVCKWDPAQVAVVDDNCDKQCALVSFRGQTKNQLVIKGKIWNVCCGKGYSPVGVDDPITRETIDVVCRKD